MSRGRCSMCDTPVTGARCEVCAGRMLGARSLQETLRRLAAAPSTIQTRPWHGPQTTPNMPRDESGDGDTP